MVALVEILETILESVLRGLWGVMWVVLVKLTLKNVMGEVLRKRVVIVIRGGMLCYALKVRTSQGSSAGQPKGACCTVSLHSGPAVSVTDQSESVPAVFLPFISDGYVSLVGDSLKVLVKILRETQTAFDSFIQASMLPFSNESHTGCWVPIVGMEMKVLQVPLHKVVLQSDLFQGELTVGVRPALHVEGVTLILGKGAAGERVWGGASPPPVVSPVPLMRKQPDNDEVSFP